MQVSLVGLENGGAVKVGLVSHYGGHFSILFFQYWELLSEG